MNEFCENKFFPGRSSTSSTGKCSCWGGRTAGKGAGCISKEKLIYIFFLLGSSSIVILESGARAARGADFLRRPKSCFFLQRLALLCCGTCTARESASILENRIQKFIYPAEI